MAVAKSSLSVITLSLPLVKVKLASTTPGSCLTAFSIEAEQAGQSKPVTINNLVLSASSCSMIIIPPYSLTWSRPSLIRLTI